MEQTDLKAKLTGGPLGPWGPCGPVGPASPWNRESVVIMKPPHKDDGGTTWTKVYHAARDQQTASKAFHRKVPVTPNRPTHSEERAQTPSLCSVCSAGRPAPPAPGAQAAPPGSSPAGLLLARRHHQDCPASGSQEEQCHPCVQHHLGDKGLAIHSPSRGFPSSPVT